MLGERAGELGQALRIGLRQPRKGLSGLQHASKRNGKSRAVVKRSDANEAVSGRDDCRRVVQGDNGPRGRARWAVGVDLHVGHGEGAVRGPDLRQ